MHTDKIICSCTPDYMETLRQIPVGESRTFFLVGRLYTNMHSAKSRFNAKEGEVVFALNSKNNTLTVTRIS